MVTTVVSLTVEACQPTMARGKQSTRTRRSKSRPCSGVSKVGDPFPIRGLGWEVTVEQIRARVEFLPPRIVVRCRLPFAADDAGHSFVADCAGSGVMALPSQVAVPFMPSVELFQFADRVAASGGEVGIGDRAS